MTHVDLTIAVVGESLEAVRSRIVDCVCVDFELRDSDYYGGLYYLGRSEQETIRVHWNRDGDELAEIDYPCHNVIVVIESTQSPQVWNEWAASMKGVVVRQMSYRIT